MRPPESDVPPRAAFAAALRRVRRQLPDVSDEMLARRASRTPLPSGRLVSVNARRLGEWLNGRSVPRDFHAVLAVVRAVQSAAGSDGSGFSVADWERTWRAAYEDRAVAVPDHGTAGGDPPRDVAVGRPPSDAASLRERPALAHLIDAALRDDGVRDVVLTGAGGMGKSQLAAAAFHRFRQRGGVRLWVPAATRQSVLTSYARAWRAVSGEDGGPGWDDEAQADLFVDWLRTTARPWLVVLDDVDDPADLAGLRPTGEHGRTLVTTRRRDSAVIRPHSRLVPVGIFTPEESVGYLGARLSQHDVREEELGALAQALGHFPLALSQAAAFLIDTGMPLATYCELLGDQRETLTDLLPATSPADEHGGTVATALQLALERAQDLAPAGSARAVLELLAMLAPDGVPEAVLHTGAARRWIDAADGGASGSGTVPAGRAKRTALLSLRALHRLSLVTHDDSRRPASVEVHALVQRAVREAVPRQARLRLARAAADALEEAWSSTAECEHQPETEAALYRSVDVMRRTTAADLLWDGRMHPVLRRLAPHLAGLGRDGAAREVCRELLEQARTRLGEGHRDVLVLRCQIALATGELGQAAAAQASLRDIGRDAERTLGPTDPDTLTVRLYEARFLMEAGAVSAALDRLVGLADQLTEEFGDHHALVVDARSCLSLCRSLSGDAVGARDGTAAFLEVLERRLGAGHPRTLRILAELGRWSGEAGDTSAAVDLHLRAVAGLEAALGRLHSDTLIARHNLAYWRGLAGDHGRAVQEFAVAAQDAERALGADHPTTLTYRVNLAYWRGLAGDRAAALADLSELQTAVDEVLGTDHPRALRTRQQRAELLELSGGQEAAITLLTALLADMVRVQGRDHPRTCEVARSLARCRDRVSSGGSPGEEQC
ncbi:FxSxx-COOH system tetratricopeptide repeat protein [Streptomyces sp. bgisy153]|uniref:FxSxx-COOH system tetratricopeptide repeat protein n=1 Tax=Streptomyces sp. bgisy153 TaxID=3413793 RepID=UPI003D74462E